jgi:hypothetical protein
MRHRPAATPLSLVIALAIVALAGCQTAPPETSTQVIAPKPFGATTPGAEAHPLTVSGQALIAGQPLANAQISVTDAVTGEAVGVIAPGGGNVIAPGGGNAVAPGGANAAPTTDANGAFRFDLAEMSAGRAVRIVATDGDRQVMTLVTGDGQSLAPGAHVLATATQVAVALSELTTTLTYMSSGAFRMLALLKPEAATFLMQTTLAKLNARAPGITTYLAANPALLSKLVTSGALGGDGLPTVAGGALMQVIAGTGGLQPWLDLNRDTIAQLVAAVRSRGSLSPDLIARLSHLKNLPLAGTGLVVSLDERSLTVANVQGQVLTTVDLTDTAHLEAAIQDPTFQQVFRVVAAAAGEKTDH